jgi:DNA invertase Pin-like site-specific DNA recombinase
MKEYCMYLRKSRADLEAEAHGEGETLLRHERTLMEYAKKNKINVTKIYREIVSGETIASRPVMQQVLSEVEKGIWAGVLVMEVERLARGDTIDQGLVAQTFKYSDTKIITPMKIYDPNNEFDEEYFEFGLFMSRREYKTINRRLQNGRIASVKEGKWVANKKPYGYKRKKLEKEKGFTLEIIPDEAAVVKMIFELYSIGEEQKDEEGNIIIKRLGSTLIADKLNNLKIPPQIGDRWGPSRILELLRNPVYIGKVRWNYRPTVKKMNDGIITLENPRADEEDWIIVDGLHDAIISDELFYKTQNLLSNNPPRPAPKKAPIKNPLAGFVYCGLCGSKMVRRPYPNRTPDALMCPKSGCKNISSYLSYVENRVLVSLDEWLNKYKLQLTIENKEKISNTEIEVKKQNIKRLEDEIKGFNKQMSSIHDFLEQGIYSAEVFFERSKIINEKLSDTKNSLDIINKSLEDDKKIKKNITEFIPKVEHVLEVYNNIEEPTVKNELLDEVVSKAIYTKTKRVHKTGNYDNFELVVFPKIPK